MGALGSVRDSALKVEGDRDGQLTPMCHHASMCVHLCTHTYAHTKIIFKNVTEKWGEITNVSIHLYASVMINSYALDTLAYLIAINLFW